MNEDVLVDRQYSHGVALTLRAYWAADEEDRDKIADVAGLIRVVGGGVPEGEQHWPYSGVYQRQMAELELIPRFAGVCIFLLRRCGYERRAWVMAG